MSPGGGGGWEGGGTALVSRDTCNFWHQASGGGGVCGVA